MGKILSWIVALALIATPILYFISGGPSFRDSAIANWFGTVIGVIVGVPIAIWVAHRQQQFQTVAEREANDRDRTEKLSSLRMLVLEELSHNLSAVRQLNEVLSKVREARKDSWDWAERITESFEVFSRQQFESLVLTLKERSGDADVALAYRDLRRLSNSVREACAAHMFYLGYSGDEGAANMQMQEVIQFSSVVAMEIERAIADAGLLLRSNGS